MSVVTLYGDNSEGSIPIASKRPRGAEAPAIVALIISALEDGKADNIVEIDLAGKTSIADRMIIASGGSQRQVLALTDRVIKALKENGHKAIGVEGRTQGDWVLVDLGDVILHIFRPETREHYGLEKMWSVALPPAEPLEAHA